MTELNNNEVETVNGGLSPFRPVPISDSDINIVKPTVCPPPSPLDWLAI